MTNAMQGKRLLEMSRNLSKCSRCEKVLIEEERGNHVCTPVLKGVAYLDIDYIVETRNEKGERLFLVKGLDGFIYRLTQKAENAPDETLQRHELQRFRLGLDRTIFRGQVHFRRPRAFGIRIYRKLIG